MLGFAKTETHLPRFASCAPEMKSFLFLLVVPLLAQPGVSLYTLEKERALGQQCASEIRRQSKPIANPLIDAYVKRVGGELVAQLKDVPFDYQFEVISDGTWTEPFSLPGGYVFIPARAFVAAQDEAEFVGMLAHSIGHVALRHGTRSQIVNMASIPLVFTGGWTGPHADSERPQTLVPVSFLEFQSTHELEADRFGLQPAARTGYETAAFQRYLERTHSADSKMSPLPPRELRLARLQETVSSFPLSMPSPSGEEFRRVQQTVRSIIERPEQHGVPTLKR